MDRAHRVNIYKQLIMFGLLVFTFFPLISGILLLDKVARMEKRFEVLYAYEYERMLAEQNQASKETLLQAAKEAEERKHTDITAQAPEVTEENVTQPDGPLKRVYLTFDDGPSPRTDELLDILAEKDVKATFFVIGRADSNYEKYYKRIVEEGHTLGMHSYSHEYRKIYESPEAFAEDLEKVQSLLYNITGQECKIFRFPGGSSNTIVKDIQPYIRVLRDKGIQYYDWNALNGDALSKELSVSELTKNVMKYVHQHDDSMVLMHDLYARKNTALSLPALIDRLKEEGYTLLPIDENTPEFQHVQYEGND